MWRLTLDGKEDHFVGAVARNCEMRQRHCSTESIVFFATRLTTYKEKTAEKVNAGSFSISEASGSDIRGGRERVQDGFLHSGSPASRRQF